MAICTLDEIKTLLPAGARLLGLDLGAKTIGMAISDPGFTVASPVGTIRRAKFTKDFETLSATIAERKVGGLIIGLPMNMDGSEGPRCQSTRQFAANFLERMDIPICFWDERLSTAAVERAMIGADLSRAKRKRSVDTAAAAYILQGALDTLSYAASR